MNPRFGREGRGPGGPGGRGGPEHAKFLADALGITVEQLQAAREAAMKAEMAQGVAAGDMTQDEADDTEAMRAFRKYIIDKNLLKAAADAAVKDGVLTQAQADQILSRPRPGMLMGGGRGGPGGPGPEAAGGERPRSWG